MKAVKPVSGTCSGPLTSPSDRWALDLQDPSVTRWRCGSWTIERIIRRVNGVDQELYPVWTGVLWQGTCRTFDEARDLAEGRGA